MYFANFQLYRAQREAGKKKKYSTLLYSDKINRTLSSKNIVHTLLQVLIKAYLFNLPAVQMISLHSIKNAIYQKKKTTPKSNL